MLSAFRNQSESKINLETLLPASFTRIGGQLGVKMYVGSIMFNSTPIARAQFDVSEP